MFTIPAGTGSQGAHAKIIMVYLFHLKHSLSDHGRMWRSNKQTQPEGSHALSCSWWCKLFKVTNGKSSSLCLLLKLVYSESLIVKIAIPICWEQIKPPSLWIHTFRGSMTAVWWLVGGVPSPVSGCIWIQERCNPIYPFSLYSVCWLIPWI